LVISYLLSALFSAFQFFSFSVFDQHMRRKHPVLRNAPAHAIDYALVAAGLVVLGLSIWISVARNLDFPWTSIRLAPAFALANHIPLYSLPDKPPWVMVGYGPLYPLAYLPSALARQPTAAVAMATVLAHFYVLAPVALLCSLLGISKARESMGRSVHWMLAFVLFALVTHLAPSLTYVTTSVHADAPAFGLFLLACYAVLRCEGADGNVRMRWVIAAGIAAGLSATCKINLAAGAVALLVWVLRFFGMKRAAVFLFAAVLAVLAIYSWAAMRDGFAAVTLNLGQPTKMPWFKFGQMELSSLDGTSREFSEKLHTFLAFGRDYLKTYGAVALAIVIILTTAIRKESGNANPATRMVWFFLFISVFLLPVSIASIAKYGGDINSRALVSLPLTLAAIFALGAAQQSSRAATIATYSAVAAAIFMVALPLKDGFEKVWPKNPPALVEAYSVISSDPSRWYFPYDPLAHILVEGKFRPNIDVVYSYAASGFPVNEEAFRSAMPENLRYIAIPPSVAGWGASEIRRLLPDYIKPAPELNFPKHRVYGK
jgi:hypothetical protein